MQNIYYVDGEYVNAYHAQIPVTDLGVVRGYGVFDFFRTYNGVPFYLEDHLRRLYHSANAVQLDLPWTIETLSTIVMNVLERNGSGEYKVRMIVTGGDTEDFSSPSGESRLIVIVTPCDAVSPELVDETVKVITIEDNRTMPEVKSINYIAAVIAMKQAKKVGAIEGLYVDQQRFVWEGTRTNLFAFFGDTLVTTGSNILMGVTRQMVLRLAEGIMPIEIQAMKLDELLAADEVFITSSSKEILPVGIIDDRQIGSGQVGKNTHRLRVLFRDYVINWAK